MLTYAFGFVVGALVQYLCPAENRTEFAVLTGVVLAVYLLLHLGL